MKMSSFIYLLFLKPTAYLVHLIFGITFDYVKDIGFINQRLGIVIGKSCSGINYFIIMFLMLLVLFSHKKRKVRWFISYLGLSYIVTIIANGSRIILSILFMKLNILNAKIYERLMHEIIGIVVYFIFLLAVYLIIHKVRDRNEKDL